MLLIPLGARAEQDEVTLGLEGGLLFPSFDAGSPTVFALTSWMIGISVSYSVMNDLQLTGGFAFSTFGATSADYKARQNDLDYEGTLHFSSWLYWPTVGLRYKVFGGYDLAPYVEASVGYLWATYGRPRLRDTDGFELVQLQEFAEGTVAVTAGVGAYWRIANVVMVGLGFRFTYVAGGLLQHLFSVPLSVSYYW